MAFTLSQLSLMAYTGAATGGHRQFAYANTAADTVTTTGFFNNAAEELGVRDTIYVLNTGITYRVASITAGVVAVAANYDAP